MWSFDYIKKKLKKENQKHRKEKRKYSPTETGTGTYFPRRKIVRKKPSVKNAKKQKRASTKFRNNIAYCKNT